MTLEESRKFGIFPKRNPWFWSKFSNFFSVCFSLKKGLNILFDNLQGRKQPFLDYKDDIITQSKNWDFFKMVNPWFWSKFSNFL